MEDLEMKRLISLLSLTVIVVWGCSEKSTQPDRSNPQIPDPTFAEVLEFQAKYGDMLDSLLSEMDTASAKVHVLHEVKSQSHVVELAWSNSQGIGMVYQNGRIGGIMIDPEDMAEQQSPASGKKGAHPGITLDSRDIPRSKKTAFLCPIYSERKSYADAVMTTANSSLPKAGFNHFETFLDDSCGIDRFIDIEGYGLVHIYTHSLAWPAKDSIDDVYAMTADTVTQELNDKYHDQLLSGEVGIFYVPGKGNTYFMSPGYFGKSNDFSKEQSIVYLGFGFAFPGQWQLAVRLNSYAAICIGYDWRVFANKNRDWACEFYTMMADTAANKHYTVDEWHDAIVNSYVDQLETTPPLPRHASIKYYGISNMSFWVALRLNSITPRSGLPGTEVKLRGTSFGFEQGESRVTYNGIEVEADSWSDTLIVAAVPFDAVSGDFKVELPERSSNPIGFRVMGITGISPAIGTYGDTIRLSGVGFGNEQGVGNVMIGERVAVIIDWSDTLIAFEIPEYIVSSDVTVIQDGIASNLVRLDIFGIISIVPNRAGPGYSVTILGSGFGNHLFHYSVRFNAAKAIIESWLDHEIRALVPGNAVSGDVVVTDGSASTNGYHFRVVRATELSSAWGAEGSFVTIHGEELDDTPGEVFFAGVSQPADVQLWTNDSVIVTVPAGARSGYVHVETGVTRTEGLHYDIMQIESLIPDRGYAGDTISVVGDNFLDYKVTDSVTFGDLLGQIVYWSDTLVRVEVPEGFTSCDVTLHVKNTPSNSVAFAHLSMPIVHGVDPDFGTFGTEAVISGSGFGSTQSLWSVMFNGVEAQVIEWLDNEIRTHIPDNCTSGDLTIEGFGIRSEPVPFQVFGITSVAPEWTIAGDTISITGTGFGDAQGSSYVVVSEVVANVVSWSGSLIRVETPEDVSSGELHVYLNGLGSNAAYIEVKTGSIIRTVVPNWGPPGANILVTGSKLGNTPGTVLFHGSEFPSQATSWSDTEVQALIPYDAHSGWLRLSTADGGHVTNELHLSVFRINSVSPNDVAVGDAVLIHGESFMHAIDSIGVLFGDLPGEIMAMSDTLIEAIVPDGVVSGQIRVMGEGFESNSAGYTVATVPTITSINPDYGTYGDSVTIRGTGFGSWDSGCSVLFKGREAPIYSWSDNTILTEFPMGSMSGDVVVTAGGRLSNPVPYGVFGISHLHPSFGMPGDLITAYGAGFGGEQGSNYITLGDMNLNVESWHEAYVKFLIPEDCPSGYVTVHINGKPSNSTGLASGPLAIAHQAGIIDVEFSAVIETSAGSGLRTFEFRINPYDTIRWDFNSLYAHREEIRWYEVNQHLEGEISLCGTKTNEIICSSNYLEEYPYSTQLVNESTFEFTLTDLPLKYAREGDSARVVFEVVGPEVQYYIDDIECFERYKYSDWDYWEYIWRYQSTDWENVENPPRVNITFRKL